MIPEEYLTDEIQNPAMKALRICHYICVDDETYLSFLRTWVSEELLYESMPSRIASPHPEV
jgi:hypothetical protein